MLTDEQWRLVEKYQHVPTWLVMKRLGKDSSLIRCALIRFGTTDDLIADLKFAVIKAIRSYDPSFGARPLKRTLQKFVESPLSISLLSGEFKSGDKVIVDLDQDEEKLIFKKK